MKAVDLKRWMERNEKTIVDVASAAKTHPQTVQRFLNGSNVHRVTLEAFKRLVEPVATGNGGQKATGT